MSSGDGEYLETFDPTGNVLRFWYERWHCQATTKDNENTENTKDSAARAMDRFERFLSTQTNSQSDDCHWSEIDKTSISYDNIIPPQRRYAAIGREVSSSSPANVLSAHTTEHIQQSEARI